ncbi:tricarboxylate transporter [Acuticoccus sediminis]|uniref:Tricarboxylate transporter n=1 Tax=Acuticoccus sediminis TaxID=2184697 RepID=A0A8B2NPS1_9HYPH|nr:tripartite tricarboxylate transporter permease [Acuticoccus sediminis]RAH98938.1 tricarboxylate transporter [Acuticoccus sediminis]
MLEQAILGATQLFVWPAIGFLMLGILIGIVFGVVPGLSGLNGMAILLPFTFSMDTVSALSFLLGMYAVTSTADTISSVLLGIPGTAASQATVLDGYPMAKRGEAERALGAAFTVSAIGGVIGAIAVVLSIPILQPIILAFSSPEFFMLGVVGLTMVGALSGGSIAKGVAAAALGTLIASVGYGEQIAIPRYWFNIIYLIDGIPLMPVVLGLFAVPEIVDLMKGGGIARVSQPAGDASGLMRGVRDAMNNWWLMLRCSVLGVYIGLLPGLGAAIADWIAYGHAVQTVRKNPHFGEGDVRGVIAPESANNAVKGGALVPTIAFGIPGSPPMALLLGAFLIQGITPGPSMLTTQLPLTFSLIWTLVVANVVAALLLFALTKPIARLIFVPSRYLVPAVVVFTLMGAWTATFQLGDWVALFGAGALGMAMKHAGWPRPPLILGFIIAPIIENALHISRQSYGMAWLGRPIVIALLVVAVVTVVLSIRRARKAKAERVHGAEIAATHPGGAAAETFAFRETSPLFGMVFAALAIAAFGYAMWEARAWPAALAAFPVAMAVPGVIAAAIALAGDFGARHEKGQIPLATLALLGEFALWMVLVVAATICFGQLVALPVFAFLFVLLRARAKLWVAALYGGAIFLLLWGVFDQVVNVTWYPARFM